MADLSPAAQSILDAYHFAPLDDEPTIAAVLYAAARAIRPTKEKRDAAGSPYARFVMDGEVHASLLILALADELIQFKINQSAQSS